MPVLIIGITSISSAKITVNNAVLDHEIMVDSLEVIDEVNELLAVGESKKDDEGYSTLEFSVLGYEYEAQIIITYDKELNLHYYESGSQGEGMDETIAAVFEQDEIVGIREEVSADYEERTIYAHRDYEGITIVELEEGEEEYYKVRDGYVENERLAIDKQIGDIISLIKENEPESEGDMVMFNIITETELNEATTYTTNIDIMLDQALYDRLVN